MGQSPLEQHQARFAENPDARGAFEFLEEHWFMEQNWSALEELYRRRLTAPSLAARARQRAQLALRLGQLLEERRADADAAIEAYTEAIRSDPALRPALQHLRRLYAARRSWETVLQIAEQEVATASDAGERARLYAEMGDIWSRELGDSTQAELLYERARTERGEPEPVDEAPEGSARLVQSAWLAAARGDTETALAALRRALELDPGDVEALDMSLSVLEGAERHEEMTELLERRAELASDAETRAAVLLRLGELGESRGDLADARHAFERASEACPGHVGAREARRRIYHAAEAWGPLRALMEETLEGLSGPARVPLLCELAVLLERQFADSDIARARLDEAAALAPDDPTVRDVRDQLGASSETRSDPDDVPPTDPREQRTTRVLGVLERKLAALEERDQGAGPEALRLRLRIGELLTDSVGEPQAALEMVEPLLEDDTLLLEVAPFLARLYERLGRLEPLAALAERAGRLADPVDQRIDWFRRAAETARAVGDVERAIACYQSLLAESPHDAGARGALCALHRSRGEFEPLVTLLRSEIPRADEGRELEIHLELAQIFSESLNDPASARSHLRRALEIEPLQLGLLERALELCGDPLAKLDLLDLVAECCPEENARATLLARRGTLLATELDWHEEAATSWRASLVLDPDQPELRSRLGMESG